MAKPSSGSGGGKQGDGKSGGADANPNYPSKTGKSSGPGRGNTPKSSKKK